MRVRIIIGTDEDDLNAKLEAEWPNGLPAGAKVQFSAVLGQFGITYVAFVS